jgi:M6 family metalloprotease-like protein
MSSPFKDKPFTFTQPDGTSLKVRGTGDQHYAVFETLDGYTVVKNPATGYYQIAQLSSDGTMLEPQPGSQAGLMGASGSAPPGLRINRDAARAQGMENALRMSQRRCNQRREERKNLARAARTLGGPMMAPPKRETVGDYVGLCLLIDFSDQPGTIARAEVERFCNQPGYSGFGNNGSVADYFLENSAGRCRYSNIVVDYYRASRPKSYYTDPAISHGTRARQLITEALNHLKSTNFDFSRLTVDSSGFVYAMNVYYAGEVVNNWSEGLWPHAWSLANPLRLATGKLAFDYQFTDMSHELSLGTFCHENGHMLCDYPDLYDYGSESGGAGAYCLMCAGGSINEKNPTHISAYLKRLSGWANDVIAIQPDREIELVAGENQFALFAKNNSEYFIIENRLKTGRDVSLPSEGLAIWHVDEQGNNSNEQMTPSKHYELSLEQADGEFRLERSRHYGDASDLFGGASNSFTTNTIPASKWWDGSQSNLSLYDISAPGNMISFKTSEPSGPDTSETVQGTSSPNVAIPDNNAAGISDRITINQQGLITGVQVTLDISHSYIGDLRVTLLTPWADTIVLHQRSGGSSNDIQQTYDEASLQALATLHGHSTQGDWILQIQDLAGADLGTLNHWQLDFAAAAVAQGPVILEEASGSHIPDNDLTGIQRSLNSKASGKVGDIEVSIDITHTWIADIEMSLRSPAGTVIMLHDKEGGSADDIVKTYTAATTPELASLVGEPISGDWQLRVKDLAGQDVGKLNAWRVVIQP